jgi:hypothetical protein
MVDPGPELTKARARQHHYGDHAANHQELQHPAPNVRRGRRFLRRADVGVGSGQVGVRSPEPHSARELCPSDLHEKLLGHRLLALRVLALMLPTDSHFAG